MHGGASAGMPEASQADKTVLQRRMFSPSAQLQRVGDRFHAANPQMGRLHLVF